MIDIINAFKTIDIPCIRKYSLDFAKEITIAVLNEDIDSLNKLIDNSCEMRDEVEFEKEISRNKEFYFGYIVAYENIARRIVEYKEENKRIEESLKKYKQLEKIICFLDEVSVVREDVLTDYIGLNDASLNEYLNKGHIRKLELISRERCGKNAIYSLTAKARRYLKDQQ